MLGVAWGVWIQELISFNSNVNSLGFCMLLLRISNFVTLWHPQDAKKEKRLSFELVEFTQGLWSQKGWLVRNEWLRSSRAAAWKLGYDGSLKKKSVDASLWWCAIRYVCNVSFFIYIYIYLNTYIYIYTYVFPFRNPDDRGLPPNKPIAHGANPGVKSTRLVLSAIAVEDTAPLPTKAANLCRFQSQLKAGSRQVEYQWNY